MKMPQHQEIHEQLNEDIFNDKGIHMRTWNRWPRFSHKYFSTMGSKVLGFSNYGVV
jgi:hypothetical protein